MTSYLSRQNLGLLSNFCFYFLNTFLSIAFTPIYLSQIGNEGYGVIGFFNSATAMLSLLDFGIPVAISREFAKSSLIAVERTRKENLLRTAEVVFLFIFLASLLISYFTSIFFANFWVTPKDLTVDQIMVCFLLMSISFSLQLFGTIYSSSLLGLSEHLALNSILIIHLIFRHVGSLVVLAASDQKLYSFLAWQILIVALQNFTLSFFTWRKVGGFFSSRVELSLLKPFHRFSSGVFIVTFLNLLGMNLDKLLVGKIVDLESLSYYTFSAGIISLIFNILVSPFYNVSYPTFSSLSTSGDHKNLCKEYHGFCQKVALLVIPVGIFVSTFSEDLLIVWLRNNSFAENASPILSVLSITWIFLSLKVIPYRLRLAYGWIRLDVIENLFFILYLIIILPLLISYYGSLGAAYSLLIFGFISCFFTVFLTHTKILKGEYKNWLILIIPFFLISVIIFFLSKLACSSVESPLTKIGIAFIFLVFNIILLFTLAKSLKKNVNLLPRLWR
ncbi:MAG: oligosaccharide flippase family protein [Deltaproteobacteria bacterium]|nr:oligosaccharide flippase family protein [Deltaproteobacteria bacterium]